MAWEVVQRLLEVAEGIAQDVRMLRQLHEFAGPAAVGARAPMEDDGPGADAPGTGSAGVGQDGHGVESPGLGHRSVGDYVPTPPDGEGNSVTGNKSLTKRQKRREGEKKRKLQKKGTAAELEGLEVTGKIH